VVTRVGEADEFDDDGITSQDRFCRFFNSKFGSAYLTAPATEQETSDNFDNDLYDLAGGNLSQSDDVDSIYGNDNGITADVLEGDGQDVVSPRSPAMSARSDEGDVPDQNVLYEHQLSDQNDVSENAQYGGPSSGWVEEQAVPDKDTLPGNSKKKQKNFAGDAVETNSAARTDIPGLSSFMSAPAAKDPKARAQYKGSIPSARSSTPWAPALANTPDNGGFSFALPTSTSPHPVAHTNGVGAGGFAFAPAAPSLS
jgi:hypothetical protein